MANQLDALQSLLTTLGGSVKTTNPGDTSALQSTLGQLQGTDYEALLKSVFQQAGGQIPGLQAAFGNAIGARSGGNSAVQAALQKLMSQTVLSGQQQIAQQQAQNMQTQAQVGAGIANATKGTKQTDQTNLGEAAKMIALMQGMQKLGVFKALGMDSTETGSVPDASASAPIDMTGFSTPSATPSYYPSADAQQGAGNIFTSVLPEYPQDFTAPVTSLDFGQNSYSPEIDWSSIGAAETSVSPAMTEDPLEFLNFADGGVVRAPRSFADGGLVTQRAAGGRRSSAPEVQTTAPSTMTANNTQGAAPVRAPAAQQQQTPVAQPGSLTELLNNYAGSSNSSPSFSGSGTSASPATQKALGIAATLNNMSGLTGGKALPGAVLGGLTGLAKAKSSEDALGVVGKTALSVASPIASAALSAYNTPTTANVFNMVAAFNPVTALTNAALGLGGTSIGQLAFGTDQKVAANGDITEATNGVFTDKAMSTPVTPQGTVIGTDLGLLASSDIGWGSSYGNDSGNGNDGGFGGGGDRGPGGSSGEAGAAAGGANAAGPGGYKSGGPVDGAGTGTSDSINAKLSDGEYVMSADVVAALGEDFFNQLQAAFHTPASMQRA